MRKLGNPKLAVSYIRVSTDRQDLGPEAQEAAIAQWASREGVTIISTHRDIGISGAAGIDKRPGLAAALHAVKEHRAGHLVVAKIDRLARDATLAGLLAQDLARGGAQVTTADGVCSGIRGIMAQFAQFERSVIAARTKAALQAKRRRGERLGQVPYGFQACDGRLVADTNEQRIIRYIIEMKQSGLSQREIAGKLNNENIPARPKTVRGVPQGTGTPGRWHQPTVCNILRSCEAH